MRRLLLFGSAVAAATYGTTKALEKPVVLSNPKPVEGTAGIW
jgi:hypothetical protein